MTLITATELQSRLEETVVCDVRWSLNNPEGGLGRYMDGHIPGALFVDLDTDLSSSPNTARHPLPTPNQFGNTLGGLGITPESAVVVYDDSGGTIAARMWWVLKSIGHDNVAVLDGGIQQWQENGLAMERSRSYPNPQPPYPVMAFSGHVDHDQLQNRPIIDVRSPERYRGDHEPVDPKAGHIPGAFNIPVTSNLDKGQRMRPASELLALYQDAQPASVLSCGSGVNACHTALAFTLAGLPMPDIYVGSFSDWAGRDLPVVTGEQP